MNKRTNSFVSSFTARTETEAAKAAEAEARFLDTGDTDHKAEKQKAEHQAKMSALCAHMPAEHANAALALASESVWMEWINDGYFIKKAKRIAEALYSKSWAPIVTNGKDVAQFDSLMSEIIDLSVDVDHSFADIRASWKRSGQSDRQMMMCRKALARAGATTEVGERPIESLKINSDSKFWKAISELYNAHYNELAQ